MSIFLHCHDFFCTGGMIECIIFSSAMMFDIEKKSWKDSNLNVSILLHLNDPEKLPGETLIWLRRLVSPTVGLFQLGNSAYTMNQQTEFIGEGRLKYLGRQNPYFSPTTIQDRQQVCCNCFPSIIISWFLIFFILLNAHWIFLFFAGVFKVCNSPPPLPSGGGELIQR